MGVKNMSLPTLQLLWVIQLIFFICFVAGYLIPSNDAAVFGKYPNSITVALFYVLGLGIFGLSLFVMKLLFSLGESGPRTRFVILAICDFLMALNVFAVFLYTAIGLRDTLGICVNRNTSACKYFIVLTTIGMGFQGYVEALTLAGFVQGILLIITAIAEFFFSKTVERKMSFYYYARPSDTGDASR